MYSFLLLNALINGLIIGVLYSLIGCSLNVLYGVLRLVNFAHGEVIVAGAFFTYVLYTIFHVHPLLAIPAAAVIFFIVGVALYWLLVPRLSKSDDPETSSFLMMYGVSIVLAALMLILFDADTRTIDFSFEPASVAIFGVYVPTARLVALAINLMIVGGLTWFLYRTLMGKAVRAAIMNRDAIQIVGVNINQLSSYVFGLALALAGVSGVLLAMIYPAFSPFIGPDYTLIGFIVIVLGGLGHPVGAIVAGIILGLTEQFATVFLPQAMAPIVSFAILIGVIFLRPAGLFGKVQLR